MTAKDVIRTTMGTSAFVLSEYLSDLTDAELTQRPAPGLNAVAWQVGHLIESEHGMISALGHKMPELPTGFTENHNRDAAAGDNTKYLKKSEYDALAATVRAATLKALDSTPDARLGEPGPESMRGYAPTVGAVFAMIGSHVLMHTGQIVPLRRKLNKPVKI